MTVEDWQPFRRFGVDVVVDEATFVAAPTGGTIGTKVFQPGYSATFIADILGTDVLFDGNVSTMSLDAGMTLKGFVEEFDVAGVTVTGAGPDSNFATQADNGVYFSAALTPSAQEVSFSGGVLLPGNNFILLDGALDSSGVSVHGQFQLPNYASLVGAGDPTTVDIAGAISDDRIFIAGEVRNWELMPLISFDGEFAIDADPDRLKLAVDAHTDFRIGSIDVEGELVAGTSGFELVLDVEAEIGIPGVMSVEMAGEMDTRDGLFMELSGAMDLLGQPILAVDATLDVDANGEWLLTVDMNLVDLDFTVPLVKADIGYFKVNLDLKTHFAVGNDLADLNVQFDVGIDVTLDVLGHSEHAGFHSTLSLDARTGAIRIPNVRPVIHLSHTLPWKWHPLHWKTLVVQIADPPTPPDVAAPGEHHDRTRADRSGTRRA